MKGVAQKIAWLPFFILHMEKPNERSYCEK